MDDMTKKPDAGLDDEKAFSETLTTDHDAQLETSEQASKEANDAGASSESQKTGVRQPSWVGKRMGHFKLLRQIGEGAMGLVIQAEDTHLKRIVALKVLRKKLAAGEKGKAAVDQFLREARAAASIEHPNIVRVYEINQHSGWWYIAMEMVEGNSLLNIVKAAGALPAARACPIIADAATALNVAHEIGMVHRDIKPSNILVTRNGRGKISDFGLVRVDDPNDPFDLYAQKSIGTPFYMAPEIIRRLPVTPAVDIYSLGATLYYTVTSRPPYVAKQMRDLLKQHVSADPPDLQVYLPGCSPNLATLIRRMMAKEPDKRPTAAEVAAILNAESIMTLADSQAMAVPDGSGVAMDLQSIHQRTRTATADQTQLTAAPATRQRSLLRWWPVLAAVVLLILGGVVFQLYRTRTVKQDPQAIKKLFPRAPQSYGTRQPGVLPRPAPLTEVPSFSWKGKVDTTGIKYVASRTGGYYYAIDDPHALLIRADQFVGYQSAEQAANDNKQPAP